MRPDTPGSAYSAIIYRIPTPVKLFFSKCGIFHSFCGAVCRSCRKIHAVR